MYKSGDRAGNFELTSTMPTAGLDRRFLRWITNDIGLGRNHTGYWRCTRSIECRYLLCKRNDDRCGNLGRMCNILSCSGYIIKTIEMGSEIRR